MGDQLTGKRDQELSVWPPNISCLINNYNYSKFIVEAVNSALNQTIPFDEIIIVDDGSTDDSRELLQACFGNEPKIHFVFKPNGGQLSAFRSGFEACRGDFIFFLDADDRFAPTKVEEIFAALMRHPDCDMICTPAILFGNRRGIDSLRNIEAPFSSELLFCEDPLTQFHGNEVSEFNLGRAFSKGGSAWGWVGSPTSAMVIRRASLSSFLPFMAPIEPFWRVRADDCLVMGLAATNASRLYLHRPITEYRIHGDNNFFGKEGQDSPEFLEKRRDMCVWLDQIFYCQNGWILDMMIDEWHAHRRECFRGFRRAFRKPKKMRCKIYDRWVLRLKFLGWLLGPDMRIRGVDSNP